MKIGHFFADIQIPMVHTGTNNTIETVVFCPNGCHGVAMVFFEWNNNFLFIYIPCLYIHPYTNCLLTHTKIKVTKLLEIVVFTDIGTRVLCAQCIELNNWFVKYSMNM